MRVLLVDAHSIIFAWPKLRALHARKMMLAREELIRQLTAYQDSTGTKVVVVFDGQGAKTQEESQPGGIQVFYSSVEKSADHILERLAATYGKTYDMTVASSDHMVQQTCITFGTFAITAEELKRTLEQAEGDFKKELKKHRRG
jgi:predicted RNA-binding protein with PIN domain